jgi:hypothetical protein
MLYVVEVGVAEVDVKLHTRTVTVLADDTKAQGMKDAPGSATGVALTAMEVVAPATLTVPLAHAPAPTAEPPIEPLVALNGSCEVCASSRREG